MDFYTTNAFGMVINASVRMALPTPQIDRNDLI